MKAAKATAGRVVWIKNVWFSLLNIGIDSLRMYLHPETVGRELIQTEVRQTLSLFGISVLWFLPTLF